MGIELLDAGISLLQTDRYYCPGEGNMEYGRDNEDTNFFCTKSKGNAFEYIQKEFILLKQRVENRVRVTKINEMSTEDQLNSRRKGIPHKSKKQVSPADVEKENRDRKEKNTAISEQIAKKMSERKEGDPNFKDLIDLACQLEEGHEDIDQYIAQVESSYTSFKMISSFSQKKPGSTVHLPFGRPGAPPIEVTTIQKEVGDNILKIIGPTLERECPNFCDEYCRTVGIPEGLNKVWAQKVLYRAFLDARMLPWSHLMGWRMINNVKESGQSLGKAVLNGKDLIKRWHGVPPMEELMSGKMHFGQVIERRQKREPTFAYDTRIRSNYVNCPYNPEIMFFGTTHVALGFNDLNSLINSVWQPASEDAYRGKPGRWVGFEMNEFNVAKTLIISQMIADESIPLAHILQVWWSSVWTKETHKSFLDTVSKILRIGSEETFAPFRKDHKRDFLAKCQEELDRDPVFRGNRSFFLPKDDRNQYNPQNVSNSKVQSYLYHWISTPPITCEEARRKWLDNTALQNGKVYGSVARDAFVNHFST